MTRTVLNNLVGELKKTATRYMYTPDPFADYNDIIYIYTHTHTHTHIYVYVRDE
jgi:hypothetical protein